MPFPRAILEEEARKNRRQEHREDQRAEKREGNRPRHRAEETAFNLLQSEDGEIRRDDDADRVEDRSLHLVRGLLHNLERRLALLLRAVHVADDVLHHHNGAVDYHAEVKRSQRKQVSRDMAKIETNRGEEQGERNRQSDDDGSANVSEEQEEDDHHKDDSLRQIV